MNHETRHCWNIKGSKAQPISNAHRKTSKCPWAIAAFRVLESHGQPCSLNHFNISSSVQHLQVSARRCHSASTHIPWTAILSFPHHYLKTSMQRRLLESGFVPWALFRSQPLQNFQLPTCSVLTSFFGQRAYRRTQIPLNDCLRL